MDNPINSRIAFTDLRGTPERCEFLALKSAFLSKYNTRRLFAWASLYGSRMDMRDSRVDETRVYKIMHDVIEFLRGKEALNCMTSTSVRLMGDMPVNVITGGATHQCRKLPTLKELNIEAFRHIKEYIKECVNQQEYSNVVWISNNIGATITSYPKHITSARVAKGVGAHYTGRVQRC